MPLSCQEAASAGIPGGFVEQNPQTPNIVNIAEQTTLLLRKDIPNCRLNKVHRAATQVVAGLNYFLVLELQAGDKISTWEVTVYQNLQRQLSVSKKRLLNERKAIPPCAIPGGFVEQDVKSQEMIHMANKAADLLVQEYPGYKLFALHKAATQVVAGINYFLLLEFSCEGKHVFWELTVYEDFSHNLSISQKRQISWEQAEMTAAVPGGFEKQDPASPDMMAMATRAVRLLAQECPQAGLIKVHQAATQIVAGTNYFFLLELANGERRSFWEVIVYQDLENNVSLLKKQQLK